MTRPAATADRTRLVLCWGGVLVCLASRWRVHIWRLRCVVVVQCGPFVVMACTWHSEKMT